MNQLEENGFTLTEVIVSILVLGIIIVVIYEMLNQGTISWEYGDMATEVVQNARIGLDWMERDIRQATQIGIADTARLIFWGDVDGKSYIPVPQGGRGGLGNNIEYVRILSNLYKVDYTTAPSSTETVSTYVRKFELQYWGDDPSSPHLDTVRYLPVPVNPQSKRDDIRLIAMRLVVGRDTQKFSYDVTMIGNAYPRGMWF
mgnify:CR=1 FL=1